jgi:cytochrome P450
MRSAAGRVLARVPLVRARLAGFVLSPAVRAEPWGLYARMQRVRPVMPTRLGATIVSRHADVTAGLRSRATSGVEAWAAAYAADDRTGPFNRLIDSTMLFRDPPDHERLRRLVSRAFTPRRVAELRHAVEAAVDRRLDGLDPLGRADLVDTLAYPVPIDVIADLLGVPPRDRAPLRGWAAALATRLDLSPMRDAAGEEAGHRAAVALSDYLTEVARTPAMRQPGGLLEELVDAASDDRLTEAEAVASAALLLIAGHETTSNLLSAGLLALLRDERALADLRNGAPADTAVEELVRHTSPVQLTQRVLLEPADLSGHTVEAGELVVLLVAAANRDESVFADPHRLDLRRSPNPHLAFGTGIHACLGAALARLEAAVALPAILDRWPRLRLDGRPRWRPTFVLRGLSSLPVRWD